MTPQSKSYDILHQNRILRQHFYVLYRLVHFEAKNVILAFEYYLDEMSDLQLSGNARLMRLYLLTVAVFFTFFAFSSKALNILHAERIGHGYHVLEDEMLYRRIIDENIHLEVSWQFTVCLPESSSVPYISVMSERTRIFRLFAAPAVAVNLLVKLPINAGDGDENGNRSKMSSLSKTKPFHALHARRWKIKVWVS